MKRRLGLALLPVALLAATPAASAGQVTHTTTAGPLALGASANLTLPQFDGAPGVLRTARVTVVARVSGTAGFENQTAAPGSVSPFWYVGSIVPVQLPSGFMPGPNPAFSPPEPPVQLAAFDGATDYAGASGVTFSFQDQYGDGAPTQTQDLFQDAALVAYVGAGTVSIALGPVLPQSGPIPPGIASTSVVLTDVVVSVQYFYDAFAAEICRATGTSGCPCGNASPALHGCGNSVNVQGGVLSASGTASLSNDTLTLAGSGMTPSSNALYFQGTAMQYAQTVYGDGLRCVAGTVVRLGTKTNSGGASSYPQGGDASVSVRGGVAAAGTRYYQVSYRDVASYCTPAGFNATSGVAIHWAP